MKLGPKPPKSRPKAPTKRPDHIPPAPKTTQDFTPINPLTLAQETPTDLKRALKRVLPGAKSRACTRIARLLRGLAVGEHHATAMERARIGWAEFAGYLRLYPEIKDLHDLATAIQRKILQMKRKRALDKRGVEGVEEPIYHAGKICGHIRRYSDKCLALALKAEEPEKYGDRPQEHAVNVTVPITFISTGVDHSAKQVIDVQVEPVEGQNPGQTCDLAAEEGRNAQE